MNSQNPMTKKKPGRPSRPAQQSPLAVAIAARREELGLTQEEVAQRMGATRGSVGLLEQGQTRSPSIDTMIALSEALELPLVELLRRAKLLDDHREELDQVASTLACIPVAAEIINLLKQHPDLARESLAFLQGLSLRQEREREKEQEKEHRQVVRKPRRGKKCV